METVRMCLNRCVSIRGGEEPHFASFINVCHMNNYLSVFMRTNVSNTLTPVMCKMIVRVYNVYNRVS